MVETSIVINGKFLRAPPTGVHRVAAELANGLAELVAENDPAIAGLDFSVWHPADGERNARAINLPCRNIGPLTGIPWEQTTLPFKAGSATLLNLCNIGPMVSGNAITMIHDVQVHLSPQSYAKGFRLWYKAVQPILAKHNRAILTVSEFSRQEIVKLGLCPAEKVVVIHNGVDHVLREPADFGTFDRLALASRGYVLGLSTTQHHKNIAVLFRAFSDRRLAHLRLVLFGSTDRAAFVQQGFEVPPNVLFAGRVSDGALRGLMERALCLAFPSTTEGFGLPPLEAMLLGCPVVVAPCGALPEVCESAALYASPNNPGAWAETFLSLAANSDFWSQRSMEGKRRAGQFTWRCAAEKLAQALHFSLRPHQN